MGGGSYLISISVSSDTSNGKKNKDSFFCVSNVRAGITIRDADLSEDYIRICIPILIQQLMAGYNKFLRCNEYFHFQKELHRKCKYYLKIFP